MTSPPMTSPIAHHIDPELLMDYAAGSLSEPVGLVVATHVALCAECQDHVRAFEAIGGSLIEQVVPVSVSETLLEATLARLDEPARPASRPRAPDIVLPAPLQAYVGGAVDQLRWRRVSPSLAEVKLAVGPRGFKTSLMRVRAGRRMPRHTHGGNEMVLVLAGGFSDDTGHYRRGDVAVADTNLTHRPIADEGEDCLCLAVVQGGLRLTGPIGAVINLFVRD